MAANGDPIYSRAGDIQSTTLAAATLLGPTANTAQDGTGTLYPVFVADATNGGYIQKLMLQSISTTIATVMRVFISDATTTVTSGALVSNTSLNTHLAWEITLPAITVSQVAMAPHMELPINIALPANYKLSVGFGTSTGTSTTGWSVVAVGGKY